MPRNEGSTASGGSSAGRSPAPQRLIAATRDAGLARALQALAGEISIIIVDDLRKLTDEMMRHGSHLALLDAEVVDAPLDAVVDALTSQFPDLRLMVAGHAGEQNLLASRLADETVFRFVHKPASPQRLKLFLEAAARETGRRRGPVAASAAPQPPSKIAFALAGLVAVVVAAAAAWLFWPEGAAARLNARDLGRVEEMLRQAGTAMNGGRLVAFDGSSAAELYRDVLQLDDVNEQARAGLGKALDDAIVAARKSLAEGHLDQASNTAEAVRLIASRHAGLGDLAALIDAEKNRLLADASARQALEEKQAQIRGALDRMQARIQAGALLDPAADNAVLHFQAAQELSAGDPAVRSARAELAASLVGAGETALAARRLPEARRHAAAAGRVNSSAPGLNALFLRIDEAAAPAAAVNPPPSNRTTTAPAPTAPAVAEPPAVAVAPAPPPATPAPVAASEPPPAAPEPEAAPAAPAAAEWTPGEGVISATKLKVLRSVKAEYPLSALNNLISGWVDLEFTVQKDGSVKDIKVTSSQPGRTFDSASIDALRRYRFTPVLKDGQPVEQRARTRMRFIAQDQQ